jgi:UDP-glucose 4-epimerase
MVNQLLQHNYKVVVLDDLSTGRREALLGGEFVLGDFADVNLLQTLFAQYQFDAVFHFAAFIHVGESVNEPAKYYNNNFVKTFTLLEAIRHAHVNNFIFSSTAAVYGTPDYQPVDIQHPTRPINPYGRSKLMVEQLLADYHHAYQLNYAVLRYFNAAGADAGGHIGFPKTAHNLIPQVLKAAAGNHSQFEIYGDDYATEDGTCIRDYVHVNDIASAHLAALQRLKNNKQPVVYNIGTGRGYSVKEIVDHVKQVTGCDFSVKTCPARAGDPAVVVADPSLLMQQTDWQPKYSSIEQIVKDAWQWYQKN